VKEMPQPDPCRTQVGSWPASDAPVNEERQRAYLLPGDLYVSIEPCQITTILGSCVSICLWDKIRRVGGMNHFLLPASREDAQTSSRFADVATGTLLEALQASGSRMENLVAKIFGGSAILRTEKDYATSLGAANVVAALRLMKAAGIPVLAQETGGNQGRKVIFNTDDGIAWSRQV
jgi:chemotaxis protein CheD